MNENKGHRLQGMKKLLDSWDEEERPKSYVEAKVTNEDREYYKILLDFKGMSYNEIRPIFEKVWDFNQHIEPMDMEHGSEKMKSPEKIEEEDVDTQEEMKEVVKEFGAKDKKSFPENRKTMEMAEFQELQGFEWMLEDFDRQDVEGDLHTLFEPDEDDEIWKNQHEYNVISWSLYDFCGIHILLMQNGIAIHMLTEKKYPLSQEMISRC
ncbi:hypothetical protein Tco_1156140 [Tanacetum coccineum]